MIELFYWPTPNGHKITLFLEEAGLDYRLTPLDIGAGAQFEPEFLAISPNNRMPAIIDHAPVDGGGPLALFESGAILEYLADKAGQFLPQQPRARAYVLQWLHWQMAGLGPMAGQNHHFNHYAPETITYAQQRYIKETARLYRVLDQQLQGKAFICGELSIVDFACHPWAQLWRGQGQDIEQFPNMAAWLKRVKQRPAVQRAYAITEQMKDAKPANELTEQQRKLLFNLD
ncbi:glutathione S-transferase N-terminal domain-containing protein [Ferrimonas senticii]|uniref:glutathione S-transferase N-terminal domain-containing protein n=1 Tax=Ferrimonas senticii TaxID=394566 RepID=UPI00041AF659|nr:glutathione S-transferase N-terminal domain-containing protein [Ferrimonas senticii]